MPTICTGFYKDGRFLPRVLGILTTDAYPEAVVILGLEVSLDALETVVSPGTTLLLKSELPKV